MSKRDPFSQMLATEGINLPPSVVQRGVDSYMLHTDVGDVRIETPLREKRSGSKTRMERRPSVAASFMLTASALPKPACGTVAEYRQDH
jgi:hypothetical protein